MNYFELIDAIANSPIIFYTLMGLGILLFVIVCAVIKGPTYGYL